MQILEVKNNIAKIAYNPSENNLLPSDFLLIEDTNQKLIAQVIDIETTDKTENNLAVLRLALNIDKDDNLSYYNGYIPAKTSKLIYITSDEIIELIKGSEDNIYFGNLSNHPSCFVKTSMSFIDDGLYIQSDRSDKTQIIFKNIISELKNKNKKVVIVDFDGQYSYSSNVLKLKISDNIKLPLNIEAFDTILKYDVSDCPIKDVAVVQSIVLELREYMKTLKDKYIPFDMFKKVVDDEFASNPVSGLMLLRNKLWLYAQDGIFADSKEQFDVINSSFFNQNIIIIDASDIADKWYKFIIQTVAELTEHDCYLFLSLNDVEIEKKAIAGLYNKPNITPIVTTVYDSSYRAVLKSLCKNQILCKPSARFEEQEYYTPLLNRMNNTDILLFGETTLFLPLQIELQPFNKDTAEDVAQNDIKRDVDKLLSSPQTVIPKTANVVQELSSEQMEPIDELFEEIDEPQITKETEIEADDDITDSDFDFLDEIDTNTSINKIEDDDDDILNVPFNLTPREDITSIVNSVAYDVFEPVKQETKHFEQIPKIQANDVVQESVKEEIFPEIEELSLEEDLIEETPLLEEISQESDLSVVDEAPVIDVASNIEEENQGEVQKQVEDEVQTDETPLIQEEQPIIDLPVSEEENQQLDDVIIDDIDKEDVSANDEIVSLDELIDDIAAKAQTNSESEEQPQQQSEEQTEKVADSNDEKKENELVIEFEDEEYNTPQKKVVPPAINENIIEPEPEHIPIYETDCPKSIAEENIPFKVGDRVYHPKYGCGTIEHFANYSNKILFCRIDFDNSGLKILDPRISGLEKVQE